MPCMRNVRNIQRSISSQRSPRKLSLMTTQPRDDCEKIAITGSEPAVEDISSQQTNAFTVRPNGIKFY